MKSKAGLIILILLLTSIIATAFVAKRNIPTPDDLRVKRTIDVYLLEKGLQARPGTKAYYQRMKGILLGEYPELTDVNLGYMENPGDKDLIFNYAAEYIAQHAGRLEYGEIPEALTP